MLMFTVTKSGLHRAAALTVCAVCLMGTVTAAMHFAGESIPTAAGTAAAATHIETTQDIAGYFGGFGYEVDLSGTAVEKVKVPRRWDDSFTAFNQVVAESGLDLSGYKGKTVEKWTALCPARSDGDNDCYCVLLVYRGQAVGAYLLHKPSGEVLGLITAAKTSAEADAAIGEDAAQETAATQGDPATQASAAAMGENAWPTE